MNPNETIADRHQQWCVHFKRTPGYKRFVRGSKEACGAGVVFDELAKVEELGFSGCALRLPCIRSHHDPANRKGQPLCECPKLRWPTSEESEAHEREIKESIERTNAAMKAVTPIRAKWKGQNWSGTVECPVCKGTLNVRHAGSNGHVWAKCNTEGCVAWIE